MWSQRESKDATQSINCTFEVLNLSGYEHTFKGNTHLIEEDF